MDRRQPLPRLWMMTDERQGDRLLAAARALPEGAGILFRHYSLPAAERRALFEEVKRTAKSRGLLLTLAGETDMASSWGADGAHGWAGVRRPGLLRSVSVHNAEEMERANRRGADLAFVSPAFPTRSHPGKPALGHQGLGKIAAIAEMPVIALGGMNEVRARELAGLRIYGWAAIDALTPD